MLKHPTLPFFFNSRMPLARSSIYFLFGSSLKKTAVLHPISLQRNPTLTRAKSLVNKELPISLFTFKYE